MLKGQSGLKDIYKDKNNNLWSITGDGAQVTVIKKNKFEKYLDVQHGTRKSTRGLIKTKEGHLLVNSYSGTFLITKDTTIRMATRDSIFKKGYWYGMGLWEDKDGSMWSGIHGSYLLHLDSSDYKVNIVQFDPSLKIQRPLDTHVIYRDNNSHTLWVGTQKGLYYLNEKNGYLELYRIVNGYNRIYNADIYHIHESKECLWIATSDGIFNLSPGQGLLGHFTFSETGDRSKEIRHIYEDDDGWLWLSTKGEGLIHWNPKDMTMEQWTTADGLSNNTIHAVYADSSNNLWIPTNHGLNKMNRDSRQIQIYLEEDGLTNNEFNWLSHYQDEHGVLYFGGINGIIAFDPNEKEQQNAFPEIVILKIDVLNKSSGKFIPKIATYQRGEQIKLTANDIYFNISYTLDNLSNPDNNRYAYKIDGLEKEWNYTQDNTLKFGRLPYGKYSIRIIGQSSNGEWTTREANIALHFVKPFYLTLPFILLLILGLVSLGVIILKRRTAILEQRNIELTSQVELRTKELEELSRFKDKLLGILSHDLKGPISSFRNLGAKVKYLMKNKEWDTLYKMADQIESRTTNLDNLLSNLLPWALAQIRNPKLNKSDFQLSGIINQSIDEVNENARQKKITIINAINSDVYINADRQSVLIIIRNILSNAIKFTPLNGIVNISSSYDKGKVVIIMEDRGVGIDTEALERIYSDFQSSIGTAGEKGHGLGLKLSRDLAISNGGNLLIESKKGSGTKAMLVLDKGNAPEEM